MKDGLYNIDFYWNTQFDDMVKEKIHSYCQKGVFFCKHYKSQIMNRNIPRVPSIYELLDSKVVEVEIINGTLVKALLRTQTNKYNSIITVVRFVSYGILYVTGWENNSTDNHKTKNMKKYIIREEEEQCV
jgi:hypothetical protein